MTPGFDPSDWLDVLVYVIVALPATIAGIAAWKKASAAHSEVTNDHGSNIRHDIDQIGEEMRAGFRGLHKDICGLREELRTERLERIEGDKRTLRAVEG